MQAEIGVMCHRPQNAKTACDPRSWERGAGQIPRGAPGGASPAGTPIPGSWPPELEGSSRPCPFHPEAPIALSSREEGRLPPRASQPGPPLAPCPLPPSRTPATARSLRPFSVR